MITFIILFCSLLQYNFHFFNWQNNHGHSKHLEDSSFILTLAYLDDIFGALNHLNYQTRGGGKNVTEAEEKMSAFQRKLQLWWQRLENNNFVNFSLLEDVVSSFNTAINDKVSDNELQRHKPVFTEHLQKLQRSFESYFPD